MGLSLKAIFQGKHLRLRCKRLIQRDTMVDNSQEYRLKYWATRSSDRSFARTAHLFACSELLASLAPSAALTYSLARSLHSLLSSCGSK